MARRMLAWLPCLCACAPLPDELPTDPSTVVEPTEREAPSVAPARPTVTACHRVAHGPCFDGVAAACAAASCSEECGVLGGWNSLPVIGCGGDPHAELPELPPGSCMYLADTTCHPTRADACVVAACDETRFQACHDDGEQIVACMSNW